MPFTFRSLAGRIVRSRLAPARCRAALLLAGLLCATVPGQGLDNARLQEAAAKVGTRAVAEVPPLLQMIERAGALPDGEDRVRLVNAYFNKRIEFREDADVWGRVDYWASPLESLNKGQGDCEDYAIAKYFSLVSAGTPVSKLRLVYVRAALAGRSLAHMVLAYYPEAGEEPLILDNLVPEVRAAAHRPDLRPVFSFNSEGLWQGTGGVTAGNPVARLSQWRELLAKVKAEGF